MLSPSCLLEAMATASTSLYLDHRSPWEVGPAAHSRTKDLCEKQIRLNFSHHVSTFNPIEAKLRTYMAQWCMPQAKIALARVVLGQNGS